MPFLESVSLQKTKMKATTGRKQIAEMFNIEKFYLLSVLKQKLRNFVGTGPDSLRPFEVWTYTSTKGLGAMLLQKFEDDLFLIAYVIKKFKKNEHKAVPISTASAW